MVGLNIVSSINISVFDDKISNAIKRMMHFPSYRFYKFYGDGDILVGATCYAEYPISFIEDEEFVFIVEGHIYNSDIQIIWAKLREIINCYRQKNQLINIVKDALMGWDGEFIVLILEKATNFILLFNDKLGRLPFFYMMDEHLFAASREIKFLFPLISNSTCNKMALAEYLMYGFPLGHGTMIDGVSRLLPATILRYNGIDHDLTIDTIVPINFEKMLRPNVRPEEEVERLRAAFLEGLNNRVNGLNTTNPVIALSGGLDSRATLAGLVYLGIIPKAITYDTDPNNFAEREVARRIADLFGLHLVYLDLPYKNGWEFPIEHYRHFVQLFDGAVSNQTNLMLILEKIAMGGGHGVTYFTGLYGGEMFRYLNITSGLKTNKDLVRYLMTTPDGFRYSLEKVCRIMDMQQNDFEEHLMEHVMEYPEKRATMKYLHFQFEKNFKWAGMGEDRNRYYFWTTTPFFSIPFFEYAYSIHENY